MAVVQNVSTHAVELTGGNEIAPRATANVDPAAANEAGLIAAGILVVTDGSVPPFPVASPSPPGVPDFQPFTRYPQGYTIAHAGTLYQATSTFSSGATFSAGDWTAMVTSIPSTVVTDSAGNATARYAVIKEAPLNPKYPEFGGGAVGDYSTDDTNAIRLWLAALKSSGATLGGHGIMTRGKYKVTAELSDLENASGVLIEAEGGGSSGQAHPPRSRIVYAGPTNVPRVLNARSNDALVLRDIGICSAVALTNGHLIDYSHGSSGSDSVNCVLDHCLVYPEGSNFYAAYSALCLENAIIFKSRDSKIGGCQWGVRGRPKDASGYSNVVTFDGGVMDNCQNGFFANAGQAWEVRGVTFEMLNTLFSSQSPSGTPYVYKSDYNVGAGGGGDLRFTGANWIGDLGTAATNFLYLSADDSMSPLIIDGADVFWGTVPAIVLIGAVFGGYIRASSISGVGAMIDLGDTTAGAGLKRALTIETNIMDPGSAIDSILHKKGHDVRIVNNYGRNSTANEIMAYQGLHQYFRAGVEGSPTVAALGGGAAPTMRPSASDARCFVEATAPGGGWAAGAGICEITWARDWATDLPLLSQDVYVKAECHALNPAAAAAGLFHDWDFGVGQGAPYATGKIRIKTNNAIAAGTTVRFSVEAWL